MTKTTMTLNELHAVLRGENKAYINPAGNVIIENIVFQEDIYFAEPNLIPARIYFTNCSFEKKLFFSQAHFKKKLCFLKCACKDSIELRECRFEEQLSFTGTFVNYLNIWGGEYKDIELTLCAGSKVSVYGGSFDLLWLTSEFLGAIEEVSINPSGNEGGTIDINTATIRVLQLWGVNRQKTLLFREIDCAEFSIQNVTNFGRLEISGITAFNETETHFQVINSNLGKAQFYRVGFDQFDKVIFLDSYVAESNIINSTWRKDNFEGQAPNKYLIMPRDPPRQLKEAFRQVRFIYEKQGDKINESFFYGLEMDMYNSILTWRLPYSERFWQKVILYLSKYLTDYGTSFLRPLCYILFGNLIVLYILIRYFNFHGLTLVALDEFSSPTFQTAIGEYFTLLNPLHKADESLKGWAILWDLISRIINSYFIYALIRSSRRYVR